MDLGQLAGYAKHHRDLFEGTDDCYPGGPACGRAGAPSGRAHRAGAQPGARVHSAGMCAAPRTRVSRTHGLCLRAPLLPLPPGRLTDKWFPHANPTRLRWEIRRLVLELMAVSERGGAGR